MPNLGIGLETIDKNALVLKCRLLLGGTTVGDVGNPHRILLPSLPATPRARRDFRPMGPVRGASRPGKLALPQRPSAGLGISRGRSRGLRTFHSTVVLKPTVSKKPRNGHSFVNPGLLNQKERFKPGATAAKWAL